MTLIEELKLLRQYLIYLSNYDITKETHPGGLHLGMSDALAEEVIILQEMKLSYPETVERMYQEAYKRAEERPIDRVMLVECRNGFICGLSAALSDMDDESLKGFIEDIKSESNFGFAFVLGVIAVQEAVKGKAYKASWQAEGELGSILPNIKRKYDRLKALAGIEGELGSDESRITTAGDLTTYAGKFTCWLAELNPQEILPWIKTIQKSVKSIQENTLIK